MLSKFVDFIADDEADDMFVTGRAGTGKTTDVRVLVAYCLANDIEAVVTAYTHKALGILIDKMPEGTQFKTVHSFLGKRPTINQHAQRVEHIDNNVKAGATAKTSVLFIDEYSMIGERDFVDLVAAEIKIVWIGDPYQLPPINDMPAVVPYGDYQIMLTEIKRLAKDNPLGSILEQLVSFIEGAPLAPLVGNENFIRGIDIVESYQACAEPDKVILAFTNNNVQQLNASIQGRMKPLEGDLLRSPTTKKPYQFVSWVEHPTCVELPFGDPLMLNSKYKTLEYMISIGTKFAELIDDEGDIVVMAVMFGHHDYRVHAAELKYHAVEANNAIGEHAAQWTRDNPKKPLAKKRKKAWRELLSFNECVICIDFAHAMTVHNSQGSTYKVVYADTEDLYKAVNFSVKMYLKLMYVALSRASQRVETN